MFSKKIMAGILCLALGAVLVPGANASAQTSAELQAQITALTAQLAALQTQLSGSTTTTTTGTGTVPAACVGITFSRNLTMGAVGTDVKCMQALLNTDAATQVAASGVGSAGFETLTFGGLTKVAVIKFQNKYAAEVLTPVGLTKGTGFVGAATRAKLNALLAGGTTTTTTTTGTLPAGCTSTVGFSPTTGLPCSGTTTTTTTTTATTGSEGDITVTLNSSPSNAKVYEGDAKIGVLGIKVKATDSDMTVQSMKVFFTAKASDFFTDMYVYDGDTKVGSKALDSDTLTKDGTEYYTTVTGLNTVVKKGETKVLTVKVDAVDSIKSTKVAEGLAGIDVYVRQDGVRAIDGIGLNKYGPADDLTARTVTVKVAESNEAKLSFSKDENTPNDRNVASGSTGDLDGVTLFVFKAKATKDKVEFTDLNNVTINDSGHAISTVYLYDGTDELATGDLSGGKWDFVDFSSIIAQDATKSYTIKADLTNLDTATSTINVDMTINEANVGAVNSADDTVTLFGGNNLIGNYVYAYEAVPEFTLSSAKLVGTNQDTGSGVHSSLEGTIAIKIKAVGGDLYIPKTNAFSVKYVESNDIDTAANVTTAIYSKPSGVTEDGNYYLINEDDTITFTVDAVKQNVAGTFDMRVFGITWNTQASGTNTVSNYMSEDFKTNTVTVQ